MDDFGTIVLLCSCRGPSKEWNRVAVSLVYQSHHIEGENSPSSLIRVVARAQVQFTKRQIEQLDELRQLTSATRTELVRPAVDYYICGIRDHGVQ